MIQRRQDAIVGLVLHNRSFGTVGFKLNRPVSASPRFQSADGVLPEPIPGVSR